MATAATTARRTEPLLLSLAADGRVANEIAFERLRQRAASATDCFVLCPGWLHDQAETQQAAARFFALLEGAARPLGDRVVPLRVALHWPSKPFAVGEATRAND